MQTADPADAPVAGLKVVEFCNLAAGPFCFGNALAVPQVDFMGGVQPQELPTGGRTRTLRPTVQVNGEGFPIRRGPPQLDGDRAEILDEFCRVSSPDREGVS